MFKITFEIEKFVNSIDTSKKRFNKQLPKAMDRIVKEGKKIMVREAPEGTGKLKKGIKTKVERKSKTVTGTIDTGQKYAIFVEKGRRAGGRPPISSIQKWVRAKGLPENIAFLIAKKIGEGRSGSNQPNPFVERTVGELENIIEDELGKVASQFGKV